MPTLATPRAPRGAGRRTGGGELVASGARLALVAIVAALALGAGPAPRTAADDVFNAMRANRVVTPMPAPGVTLPALDGGSMRLEDLRGRVVIVGFFVSG